jgi:RimJ/RimL family protein N-acetyltransferase
MLLFNADKKRLLRHFQKDPALFAYHIGDLDDFDFPNCQWAVDYQENSKIQEVILIFRGLEMPTVLAFGLTDRFNEALTEIACLLPDKFHCHYQSKWRSVLLDLYDEDPYGSHIKMTLISPEKCREQDIADGSKIVRLDDSHLPELEKLYERAYPGNYFTSRMLGTGKYYGLTLDGKIASVSGVHIYSPEYKVAALGNIVTDQAYRGKGLATRTTARLTAELHSEGMQVSLNVKADNEAAIACYRKLGFEKTHDYDEGLFTRRTDA